MSSITGVADCWKLICQSDGLPSPAQTTSRPAISAQIVTATAVNRLNTSIVVIAPSMRPSIRRIVSRMTPKHDDTNSGSSHPERSVLKGALGRASGRTFEESRQLKTTIPGSSQCTLSWLPCGHPPSLKSPWDRAGHDPISATMRCSTVPPCDACSRLTWALDFSLWKRVTSAAGTVVALGRAGGELCGRPVGSSLRA